MEEDNLFDETKGNENTRNEQEVEKCVFARRSKLLRSPATSRESSHDSVSESDHRIRSLSLSAQDERAPRSPLRNPFRKDREDPILRVSPEHKGKR